MMGILVREVGTVQDTWVRVGPGRELGTWALEEQGRVLGRVLVLA